MSRVKLLGVSGKIYSGKDTVGKILQYLSSDLYSVDNFTFEEWLNYGKGDYRSEHYQIKKYADKLKDMVCLLIGCTREQLEDSEFKETELGEQWWYYKGEQTGKLFPYNSTHDANKKLPLTKLTPRRLLQLLGTEAGRDIIHPNIWCNSLFSDYKPLMSVTPVTIDFSKEDSVTKFSEPIPVQYPSWIITDVRFQNEAQAIKDRGGVIIRVNRPGEFITQKRGGINITLVRNEVFDGKAHESETALDNYEFDYTINNDGSIQDLIEKVKELDLV